MKKDALLGKYILGIFIFWVVKNCFLSFGITPIQIFYSFVLQIVISLILLFVFQKTIRLSKPINYIVLFLCIFFFAIFYFLVDFLPMGLDNLIIIIDGLFFNIFYYAPIPIVLLLIFMVIHFREMSHTQTFQINQLKEKIESLQIESLQTKLEPHFLFNAIHSISLLANIGDIPKTNEAISSLTDLLRLSLSKEGKIYHSIEEEIDMIRKYIQMEKYRLGPRLKLIEKYPKTYLDLTIPFMITQPIIENAFKHCITDNLGNVNLELTILNEGADFELILKNTGILGDSISKSGMGVDLTQKRLKKIFPNSHTFQLVQEENNIVVCHMKFPLSTRLK